MNTQTNHPRLIPPVQMSPKANHNIFSIPCSNAGNVICGMYLVWGVVEGRTQPVIYDPLVRYPGFRPATSEEIEAEVKFREESEDLLYAKELAELYL